MMMMPETLSAALVKTKLLQTYCIFLIIYSTKQTLNLCLYYFHAFAFNETVAVQWRSEGEWGAAAPGADVGAPKSSFGLVK